MCIEKGEKRWPVSSEKTGWWLRVKFSTVKSRFIWSEWSSWVTQNDYSNCWKWCISPFLDSDPAHKKFLEPHPMESSQQSRFLKYIFLVKKKAVSSKFLVFSEFQLVTACLLFLNITSRLSMVRSLYLHFID
jgi:hypothetical protein